MSAHTDVRGMGLALAASIEIVLPACRRATRRSRGDPAAIESPDEETTEGYERSLPDGAGAAID